MDVLDIAMNSNEQPSILGFLDDNVDRISKLGIDVLGTIDDYPEIVSEIQKQERFCQIVYTIGINDGKVRAQVDERMKSFGAIPYTLTHQSAIVSQFSEIGQGAVLGHGCVVTANAYIGAHTHLNTHASVNQGSYVGEYCTLSPGARICGDVKVGDRVSFGSNSTVINLKTIGKDSTIGAGAVVVHDIPEGVVAKGVPARF
jgi:sugar O-acyltransferase (sialic acid O-acetyltransferase NeuD family)